VRVAFSTQLALAASSRDEISTKINGKNLELSDECRLSIKVYLKKIMELINCAWDIINIA